MAEEHGKHGKWTAEEDENLKNAVKYYGEKQWRLISEQVPGRTPIQCLHRWSKILRPGLVKGPWSAQEDKKLQQWVEKEGETKWSQCAQLIKGRSGKQCRERWFNILNPYVKKGSWSPDEDAKIFQMYQTCGPRWTTIAASLPGRTENSVKNRFYSTIRKMKAQTRNEREEEETKTPDRDERMVSLINQVQDLENMLSKTRNEIITLEASLQNDSKDFTRDH